MFHVFCTRLLESAMPVSVFKEIIFTYGAKISTSSMFHVIVNTHVIRYITYHGVYTGTLKNQMFFYHFTSQLCYICYSYILCVFICLYMLEMSRGIHGARSSISYILMLKFLPVHFYLLFGRI